MMQNMANLFKNNDLPNCMTAQTSAGQNSIAQPSTAQKRPLDTRNNNNTNSKNARINPHSNQSKQKLHSFNSFVPNESLQVIDLTNKDDGFKIAVKKKFYRNNGNKDKVIDSIGRGNSDLLTTNSKQFYIYIGRLPLDVDADKVKSYLVSTFPKIKFDNLKELNSTATDRTFKSFSFSVDYLNRNIIEDKELWPCGSIINIHKLPYDEWLIIAKKIEDRKAAKHLRNSANKSTKSSTSLEANNQQKTASII